MSKNGYDRIKRPSQSAHIQQNGIAEYKNMLKAKRPAEALKTALKWIRGKIMNFVQPIRDKNTLKKIADDLKAKNEKYYIMFMIGIYSGLRVSDILKLQVKDIQGKDHIRMREKKTGKYKSFPVNPAIRNDIAAYCEGKQPTDYVVPGKPESKPVSREYAHRVIHEAGKRYGLDDLGTHSMRKTFGYHYYTQTKDIATLMKIFNHSSESITLRYIGIEQQSIDEAIMNFSY